MAYLLNVLFCMSILLQLYCVYANVDVNNLPKDSKTGLLSYTPDLSKMSSDEIVTFRDMILYNPGHERFCKVSGLPNNIWWKHWGTANWCRKEILKSSGWSVERYEDLCCEGHGSCSCHSNSHRHCRCEH